MRWALLTAALAGLVIWLGLHQAMERVAPVGEARAALQHVRERVAAGDWAGAEEGARRLAAAWRRALPVLSVVASHGDLLAFEVELARLEAAVRNRDAGLADLAADAAMAVWTRLVTW